MIAPKRPTGCGWTWMGSQPRAYGAGAFQRWRHDSGIVCLSAVEVVEQNPPGSGLLVPHFHVSCSMHAGTRFARSCNDQEVEVVRAAFRLGGAEEDNHGAGLARHLWIVVGRDREPECPCKQDEERIVEGPRVRHDAPARITQDGSP